MPPVPRLYAIAVVALTVATVAGMALLWPGPVTKNLAAGTLADSDRARIDSVTEFDCAGVSGDMARIAGNTCQRATATLETGPETGRTVRIGTDIQGLGPVVDVGDQVRLAKDTVPAGQQPGGELDSTEQLREQAVYTIIDFERRAPMLWLAIAFALAVLAFGRWRGALSLVGLAVSLGVVVFFVAPAILDGSSPLAVALVASFAIMLSTIALAHGLGPKSIAAILGTAGSLLLTVGLAVVFTDMTHLTGLSSDEAAILSLNGSPIDFQGLLLAGMVIGALGVLDDVTISQSSTVMALRSANPDLRFGELFGLAMRVGRDHVSATVNTLVLAYVGASLPLVLLFSTGDLPFLDALNLELVAKEIVAMLVGSLGLIAAVPITTALAVVLSASLAPEQLEGEHAHAH